MRIYGDSRSGNCLKVKYTADRLGLPYAWQEVDVANRETRSPAFLRLNPQGQVPLLVLEDGSRLSQSNAIITYLATGSPLLPDTALAHAKVLEWLFWEQYSHEPYIAVCRYHMVYLGRSADQREAWRVERGDAALDLMERELDGRNWFAGPSFSIADVALLAYTRLAAEGGFDLNCRPNVQRWIDRSEVELGLAPA